VADGNNEVGILLGNGDGTFQPVKHYPAGSGPSAIAAADVNHDGNLDLIVGNSGDNKVSVLLGNGDGTFQSPKSFAVGNFPASIAVGDFNGDGNPDLAVANAGGGDPPVPGSLSILLGNGDGTFTNGETLLKGSGSGPTSVAVGDFNGDGKLDLAVANIGTSLVNILLGNGDGTFTSGKNISGLTPVFVAVSDINGDGKQDLVVASFTTSINSIAVLLGNGDGTFGSPIFSPGGVEPSGLVVGDFNNDNKPDVAVFNLGRVNVLLGKGDGTFQPKAGYDAASSLFGIAAGDFNNDKKLDLVVANHLNPGFVSLLQGNGDGTFQAARSVSFGTSTQPLSAATADFNGDGKADLVFADRVTNDIKVLLGNGDGTFKPPTSIRLGGSASSVVARDFNNDGKIDIGVAGTGTTGGFISILLGNGDGTFKPPITTPVGKQPASLAAGDFNGDGILDVVVASVLDSDLFVLLGNGDGSFKSPIDVPFQNAGAVAVGDFNGDGILDLIATNGSASVFLGNGDGTFQAGKSVTLSGNTGGFVTVADFNADKKLDLAIALQGGIDVLLGNGDGTFQPPTFISYHTLNIPAFLGTGDFNGDGKLDLVSADGFDNNVSLLLGNGDGSFQKPIHFAVAGDAGCLAVGNFTKASAPDVAAGLDWAIDSGVTILINAAIR
jgi:hypothetical protein